MEHKKSLLNESTSRRGFIKSMSAGMTGLAAMGGMYLPQKASAALFGSDKSQVEFVVGSDRREATYQALRPFRKDVENAIGNRRVVMKVNAGMAHEQYTDNSCHAEQLRGVLDFLKEIHEKQITISEGTAGAKCSAFIGFENYGYMPLEKEYNCKLEDANDQPYSLNWIHSGDFRPTPINIIDTFTAPDVFLISVARMKTHNAVVATYSMKNVLMGSPVCHYQDGRTGENEKSKMHGGRIMGSSGRELSYNLFQVAMMGVVPDLSIIDGVVTIEGDGPWGGDNVEHNVTVASIDPIAADRLCVELMGIDPNHMKYLEWCGDAGLGNFDLSNIDVNGPDYKKHIMKYKLNSNVEEQIAWIHEYYDQ